MDPMGLVIFWIVMAAICAIIARSKGRSGLAYFLGGLALWPIVLVVAIVKPRAGHLKGNVREQPHGVIGGMPFWFVGHAKNAPVDALVQGTMTRFTSVEALRSFAAAMSNPTITDAPQPAPAPAIMIASDPPPRRDGKKLAVGFTVIAGGLIAMVMMLGSGPSVPPESSSQAIQRINVRDFPACVAEMQAHRRGMAGRIIPVADTSTRLESRVCAPQGTTLLRCSSEHPTSLIVERTTSTLGCPLTN